MAQDRTTQSPKSDQDRWNARYAHGFVASFVPHRLMMQALSQGMPDGPVADLASGPSGSALLAASAGRQATAGGVSGEAPPRPAHEGPRPPVERLIPPGAAGPASWGAPAPSPSPRPLTG